LFLSAMGLETAVGEQLLQGGGHGGECLKISKTHPKKRTAYGLALVSFCVIPWFARHSSRYNSRAACESPRARGAAAAIDLPWRRRRVMQHTPKKSNVTHLTVTGIYLKVESHTGR
jgi:hypothetical protein